MARADIYMINYKYSSQDSLASNKQVNKSYEDLDQIIKSMCLWYIYASVLSALDLETCMAQTWILTSLENSSKDTGAKKKNNKSTQETAASSQEELHTLRFQRTA